MVLCRPTNKPLRSRRPGKPLSPVRSTYPLSQTPPCSLKIGRRPVITSAFLRGFLQRDCWQTPQSSRSSAPVLRNCIGSSPVHRGTNKVFGTDPEVPIGLTGLCERFLRKVFESFSCCPSSVRTNREDPKRAVLPFNDSVEGRSCCPGCEEKWPPCAHWGRNRSVVYSKRENI